MNYSSELYIWILNSLFVIGILLLPVGLGFCLQPGKMFKIANRMNKWISTDIFFSDLNKPRYKEYFFYRHHRIFGTVITIASIVCLYVLTISTSIESVTHILIRIAESEFEKWLFVRLYYVLIATISLTVIFGVVMFVRPSSLKSFEKWSNHWVDTDAPLIKLDKQNNTPDRILPGKYPRIFGFIIILAAIYIIWRTYP